MTGEVLRKETEVLVIGGGPGGYAAAFHAADLGLSATVVDDRQALGGVCLHDGCIPSKALLHAAEVITESAHAEVYGIRFAPPEIDLTKLREWKNGVIKKMTAGLAQIARLRGVELVRGRAGFAGSDRVTVRGSEDCEIRFQHAIVATGSSPTSLPHISSVNGRVMDSSGGLDLGDAPQRLLVIGGGYIGLELGTVYSALGSRVTVVELTDGLLPGVDRDLVRPLARRIQARFEAVYLNTSVDAVRESDQAVEVDLSGKEKGTHTFDRVLVSVGRRPNSAGLGLENTQVRLDDQGFIQIDEQCRTTDPGIFAIGDVAGQPMLAHKAAREGKVAAEVIARQSAVFDNLAIPAVVFTDPEIAWCGLTEGEARDSNRKVSVARFPWAASGRANTLDRTEGLTKIIFDPDTRQVLGVGIVGPGAGELINEGVLAVEMAAVAEDLGATIHAHPTLSETFMEAAESLFGHATHIYRKPLN